MKRRYMVIGLAAIAVVAIASSALGGPSLQSLVKQEVAKQLNAGAVSSKSKKGRRGPTGPAGPAGTNGTNGTPGANGANGTARAYAAVLPHVTSNCTIGCSFNRSKGITAVGSPSIGVYCVTATGISSADVSAVSTADWGLSAAPEGNAVAMPRATAADCPLGQFEVVTLRRASASSADAAKADDVGFTIVIP